MFLKPTKLATPASKDPNSLAHREGNLYLCLAVMTMESLVQQSKAGTIDQVKQVCFGKVCFESLAVLFSKEQTRIVKYIIIVRRAKNFPKLLIDIRKV